MKKLANDVGLLTLRVGFAGILAVSYGWYKVTHFSELLPGFPDPLGVGATVSLILAVLNEFLFPIAIVLGIFTRWVTVPVLLTMLIATFIVHAHDPWAKQELALLYTIPFVTVLLSGPGRLSLDFLIRKKS